MNDVLVIECFISFCFVLISQCNGQAALSTAGAVATQSSTFAFIPNPANLAIDGDASQTMVLGSQCARTGNDVNAWWQVEFLNPITLDHLIVTPASELGGDFLPPFHVYTAPTSSDPRTQCNYFPDITDMGQILNIPCHASNIRVVRIQLNETNRLLICEVAFYGPLPSDTGSTTTNVVTQKSTTTPIPSTTKTTTTPPTTTATSTSNPSPASSTSTVSATTKTTPSTTPLSTTKTTTITPTTTPGVPIIPPPPLEDRISTTNAVATQSSTYSIMPNNAQLAINDNSDQTMNLGKQCSRTMIANGSWWQIDFPGTIDLHHFFIYPPKQNDQQGKPLPPFVVYTALPNGGLTICYEYGQTTSDGSILTVPCVAFGISTVRIQIFVVSSLDICQIYFYKPPAGFVMSTPGMVASTIAGNQKNNTRNNANKKHVIQGLYVWLLSVVIFVIIAASA